jgi:hypothetical protein
MLSTILNNILEPESAENIAALKGIVIVYKKQIVNEVILFVERNRLMILLCS